jgi:hypothetical protein
MSPTALPLRSHASKINKLLHFLKRQIIMSESNITNFIFTASNDNEKTFEVPCLVGHRVKKLIYSSAYVLLKKSGEQVA